MSSEDRRREFESFFERATKFRPFPYQWELAKERVSSRGVHVPTGAGKTAAAVLAWLWRRKVDPGNTPRRLVYCLPMRVLVEQVRGEVDEWLRELRPELRDEFGAYTLMGGEVEEDWELSPERSAILIGTQDMLLSRALNRGYALSRYRWPVHFGLLNNDCLWVCDEVQLMGNGLGTTTQLQAFREQAKTFGPTATWWMSATMDRTWLKTVDYQTTASEVEVVALGEEDLGNEDLVLRYDASKPVERLRELTAETVGENHRSGSLTLVILNTVERARILFESGRAPVAERSKKRRKHVTGDSVSGADWLLIHSRFRPPDRQSRIRKMLIADQVLRGVVPRDLTDAERGWVDRIRSTGVIVASTQVVEAGVDISAESLITELAPWGSLVQRFGRCNRFGMQDRAKVLWADVKDKEAAPYEAEDLQEARRRMRLLNNAGIRYLDAAGPMPRKEPTHVIRQHDLHGLFSTERDLAGGFTDVSAFVRDSEQDASVYVYWRAFEGTLAKDEPAPERDELCAIPFYELKNLLGDKHVALEWNGETEDWEKRRQGDVRPGMTLLLNVKQGGYRDDLGWTGRESDRPTLYTKSVKAADSEDRDNWSETDWWALRSHLQDTEVEAQRLVAGLGMDGLAEGRALTLAARWHDIGKLHERWQAAVERVVTKAGKPAPGKGPWAKFPRIRGASFRPGLRHEAASGILAWEDWQRGMNGWTALAVYLVASHHGKVRTVLRSRLETGEDVFGIQPGERLPPFEGWLGIERELDLACRVFGASGEWNDAEGVFSMTMPSWVGMVDELLGPEPPANGVVVDSVPNNEPRELGPFRLAYFEALIVASDINASNRPGGGGVG